MGCSGCQEGEIEEESEIKGAVDTQGEGTA